MPFEKYEKGMKHDGDLRMYGNLSYKYHKISKHREEKMSRDIREKIYVFEFDRRTFDALRCCSVDGKQMEFFWLDYECYVNLLRNAFRFIQMMYQNILESEK